MLGEARDDALRLGEGRQPPDLAAVGAVGGRIGDQLPAHPGKLALGLLPGRVDVEHHHHVREHQRATQLPVGVQRA